MVYSAALSTRSQAPWYVELDSGIAYRLLVTGDAGAILIVPHTIAGPMAQVVPSGTARLGATLAAVDSRMAFVATSGTQTQEACLLRRFCHWQPYLSIVFPVYFC